MGGDDPQHLHARRQFDQELGPVTWSALELLARGRLERLKQCPGPGCAWLFLDTSKGGARRWCDMATCGNRAKARRHRAG